MFSKSGEDKKKVDQQSGETNESVPPPATQTPPAAAPKSPATVRDKLAKLRLPRAKEKRKVSIFLVITYCG